MARRSRSTDMQRRWAAEQRAAERERAAQAREAERQRKFAEKEARQAYLDRRLQEAERHTADVDRRIGALGNVLSSAVGAQARPLNFETLKQTPTVAALDLGADSARTPPPTWEQYAPIPPGLIGRLFGGEARYARDRALAEQRYTAAVEEHRRAEEARQVRVLEAQRKARG